MKTVGPYFVAKLVSEEELPFHFYRKAGFAALSSSFRGRRAVVENVVGAVCRLW